MKSKIIPCKKFNICNNVIQITTKNPVMDFTTISIILDVLTATLLPDTVSKYP